MATSILDKWEQTLPSITKGRSIARAATRPVPRGRAEADATSASMPAPFNDLRRRTETVMITPEIAERLLAREDPNRPSALTRVASIARDIVNGAWKHNGETICISRTGRVLDGRHRLLAVVTSGKAILSEVAFGISDDAFDSYDQGDKRRASHVLGLSGEIHCTTLASVLTLLASEDAGRLHQLGGGGDLASVGVVSATLARHPGIRDSVAATRNRFSTASKLITPRLAGWAHYRFTQADPVAAETFFEGLDKGTNLDKGDPILLLRNRMIARSSEKAKLPPREILALTIVAFNHHRAGKKLRFLVWRAGGSAPQDFPTLD